MDQAGRPQILQNRHGLPRPLTVVGTDPRIQRTPRTHDVIQRAHRFFQRRVGIETVRIKDVHVVQPHALQRLVAGRDQVFPATPLAVRPLELLVARFRRDDQFIPVSREIRLQDLAEGLLGAARRRAVIVRQIEMRDPVIECRPA